MASDVTKFTIIVYNNWIDTEYFPIGISNG